MVEEGVSVPKFAVNDSNGKKVKSTDFKGKKHVIYFYPKDFTPVCTTELGELAKMKPEFEQEM